MTLDSMGPLPPHLSPHSGYDLLICDSDKINGIKVRYLIVQDAHTGGLDLVGDVL